MVRTYDWLRGYSERLGLDDLADFRSGFSSGNGTMSDTPQNPFFVGAIAMEMQGPWVMAQIEKLKPEAMRCGVPADQLARERNVERIKAGMTTAEVEAVLGRGTVDGNTERWPAGIKSILVTYEGGTVRHCEARLQPAKHRQQFCRWGASAFPSDEPGKTNVTYAGMDVWAIPSTAKHKDEAFEFIAFASRQSEIERLASMHCNLSPLAQESRNYLEEHPNPYIDLFEALASSPNARPLPAAINWFAVNDELRQVAERASLLQAPTRTILSDAQRRAQRDLDAALAAAGEGGTR
jgi:ABC-type glycerol-3-phosphate transport system substrate-binding protein